MGKKKQQQEDEEEDDDAFKECVRVTNPCKICLQSVDDDTGLQCQGACEAWVHYECLNYTPGKISDIQTGLITVTCPCPDCRTTIPREFLTDAPFACNNIMCPANNPPSCVEPTCQANELTRRLPPKCPPPNTLRQCDAAVCRAYSSRPPSSYPTSLDDPCMQGFTLKTVCGDMGGREQLFNPNQMGPRGGGPMQNDVMQQMCKTVGDLARELNSLLATFKVNQGGLQGGLQRGLQGGLQGVGGGMRGCGPPGLTCGKVEQGNVKVIQGGQGGMKPCGSTGSSCGGQAGCKECGGLSLATNKNQCTGGCGHAGEVKCSQPCHCPGNPVKKY